MTTDQALRCRCGAVHGLARAVTPRGCNRAICYCDDCQTFAHHVERADLLDEHGGTEVVQLAPDAISFHSGAEHIAALRLSPKGLYRWHATCCRTPLGNTLGPALPFVGLHISLLVDAKDAAARERAFGPVRGTIMRKFAIGEPPASPTLSGVTMGARVVRLLATWKLFHGRPSPFFDERGAPRYPITVLTLEQRQAAHKKAGPRPAG